MRQGEIWYANLNPIQGSEQAGRWPVLVISGNMLNQHLPVTIVAPLTTKIKNYKGNPVLTPNTMNGLKQKSEVLIFHVRSVSKNRLLEKVGHVDKSTIAAAIKTLNDLLTY